MAVSMSSCVISAKSLLLEKMAKMPAAGRAGKAVARAAVLLVLRRRAADFAIDIGQEPGQRRHQRHVALQVIRVDLVQGIGWRVVVMEVAMAVDQRLEAGYATRFQTVQVARF